MWTGVHRPVIRILLSIMTLLLILSAPAGAQAQQLDPRRWTLLPTATNIHGMGYVYTDGDLAFEPVLLIDDATLTERRVRMDALGNEAWRPGPRERKVSVALQAYALMATSADRGGVRDRSQLACRPKSAT